MKKNVFFALFALVALVFVGCETKTQQPTQYTISINPTELELGVGEQVKLAAVISPVTEQVPAITWTTDNPEVATVNGSGIVETVAPGVATITATLNVEGVAPATCVVTVTNDAVLNNFVIGGYGFMGITGNPIPGTDTTFSISVGEVHCQLAPTTYYVWNDGIVYVDGTGFTGEGFLFPVECYGYMIVEGDYTGYGLTEGFVAVETLAADELVSCVGNPGELVDVQMYGDGFKGVLEAKTEEEYRAAEELIFGAQTGTQFCYIDFTNQIQDFNWGNVTYAAIVENDSLGLLFDLKLEWFDCVNENRLYGLAAEYIINGEDSTLALVEPYNMRFVNKEYSNMPIVDEEEPAEAPAAMKLMQPLRLSQENITLINETKKMYKK